MILHHQKQTTQAKPKFSTSFEDFCWERRRTIRVMDHQAAELERQETLILQMEIFQHQPTPQVICNLLEVELHPSIYLDTHHILWIPKEPGVRRTAGEIARQDPLIGIGDVLQVELAICQLTIYWIKTRILLRNPTCLNPSW